MNATFKYECAPRDHGNSPLKEEWTSNTNFVKIKVTTQTHYNLG